MNLRDEIYENFLFCLVGFFGFIFGFSKTRCVMIQSTNIRRDSESCTTFHDDNIFYIYGGRLYHNCNKSVVMKEMEGKICYFVIVL